FGHAPTGLPESAGPVMLERMSKAAIDVRRRNPHVPAALARLAERCLAEDPAARPTAAEVAAARAPKKRAMRRGPSARAARAGVALAAAMTAWLAPAAHPDAEARPEPDELIVRAEGALKRGRVLMSQGKQSEAKEVLLQADQWFRRCEEEGPERQWR